MTMAFLIFDVAFFGLGVAGFVVAERWLSPRRSASVRSVCPGPVAAPEEDCRRFLAEVEA